MTLWYIPYIPSYYKLHSNDKYIITVVIYDLQAQYYIFAINFVTDNKTDALVLSSFIIYSYNTNDKNL